MKSVGIKVLKNKLSEYVHTAAKGEIVLVTDRGKVVAELVPPRVTESIEPAERKWPELVRKGLVRPPRRKLVGPPPTVPLASHDVLQKELAADRSDR